MASGSSASASTFRYNARMAVALLPCIALMLGMGGKPVSATLTLGLMISYILDSLLLKRGAFFGVWFTLVATGIAYFICGTTFASSASASLPWTLQALSLVVLMELIFLVGVWASLQFRWLHLENPSVVVALERLLFASTPFVAATCQTWGVVAAVGLEHAAFYLMGIQFVLFWLFSLPRPSSFKTKVDKTYGGQIASDALLMGPLEACMHTLMLLFLPLLLHLAVHHRRLGSLNALCELVLLFFIPLLFLLYASTRGALWWLVKDQRQLDHFRVVNTAISLTAVVICLEVRVVFHAFNQYIQITPPFNYVLVTCALLGAAAAVGLYLLGHVRSVHLSVLLLAVATSSSLVVGMPLKFLPAPIVAAVVLAHYMTSRNLVSYFVFVLAASVTLAWFMYQNFWFLSIWIGGTPLKSICKMIMASAILALSLPGLTTLPGKARYLVDVSLLAHAAVVCNLEDKLYNYASMFYFTLEEEPVYPSYMVVMTTLVGLLLTKRMEGSKCLTSLGAWALYCVYASKLSMLVLSSRHVVWATAFLLLAVSPPVLLYKQKGKLGSRMKPWQGFAHAAVIMISLWWCRGTIFETLQWFSGRRPADIVLLGSLILLTGVASAPIVVYHFNHIQSARRSLVLVVVTGMLCILLQPPLPSFWSLAREESSFYIESVSADDATIYGGMGATPTWSTWLLVLTVVTSLAAVSSALPIQHFVALRFVYAVGVGTNLGLYIASRFFPELLLVGALVLLSLVCGSVFLVFLLLPSASSPRFMPWVFGLVVALLPVTYMLEGQLRGWETGEEEKLVSMLALRGARASLLGLYAAIFMLIALVVKFQLASIQKEKSLHGGFVPKQRLIQQQRASYLSPLVVKKLAAEGAWMPAVGNVATLLCFGICVLLNNHMTGGSDRAVLFLAPILLLLNQDVNLVAGFSERQRYLPVSASVSIYLTMSATYKLWTEVWHGRQTTGWGLETGGAGLFYAVKNGLLLLATLPSHASFNLFMWNQVKQSNLTLMLTSPMNIPAIVSTDISTIRALGLVAVIYALLQFVISRRIRIAGMKFI